MHVHMLRCQQLKPAPSVGVGPVRADDLQHGGVCAMGSVQLHSAAAATALCLRRVQGHAFQRAALWSPCNAPHAGSHHMRLAAVAAHIRLRPGKLCKTTVLRHCALTSRQHRTIAFSLHASALD